MIRLRAETLFRLCGLSTAVFFTLQVVLRPIPGVLPIPGAEALLRILLTLFGLGFAALFWFATAAGPSLRPAPRTLALVAVQLAVALLLHTDFLYIVAAELAYLLPPLWAFRALAVQTGALGLVGAAALRDGSFEASPEFAHLPVPAAALLTLATLVVVQLFAFAAGYLAASERRARDLLVRQAAELRAAEGAREEEARLRERLAIARDLHDTVGHHLTTLAVQLELARQRSEGPARTGVERGLATARALLADVRRVASDLRREPMDFPAALASLADGGGAPPVRVLLPDAVPPLAPAAANALFRCAQEGITNAVRHAAAGRVEVRLVSEGERLVLVVEDDGRGAAELVEGNGLKGMRERLQEAGGTLEIAAAPGRGLRLTASVPAAAEEAA